jgi:hypothetical protein
MPAECQVNIQYRTGNIEFRSQNSMVRRVSPKGAGLWPGKFDKCRVHSTNRPLFAKQSQSVKRNAGQVLDINVYVSSIYRWIMKKNRIVRLMKTNPNEANFESEDRWRRTEGGKCKWFKYVERFAFLSRISYIFGSLLVKFRKF